MLAARALAFLRGRDYALPDDVRDLARDVLRHRIVLSYEALAEDLSPDDLLTPILEAVPVPTAPLRERAGVRRAGSGGSGRWRALSGLSPVAGSGGVAAGGGDATWARPPR